MDIKDILTERTSSLMGVHSSHKQNSYLNLHLVQVMFGTFAHLVDGHVRKVGDAAKFTIFSFHSEIDPTKLKISLRRPLAPCPFCPSVNV